MGLFGPSKEERRAAERERFRQTGVFRCQECGQITPATWVVGTWHRDAPTEARAIHYGEDFNDVMEHVDATLGANPIGPPLEIFTTASPAAFTLAWQLDDGRFVSLTPRHAACLLSTFLGFHGEAALPHLGEPVTEAALFTTGELRRREAV